MAAAKKKTYKYEGKTQKKIKAKITVEVETEDWEYLQEWLDNAPSCGEDYGVDILKIEAQEL